MSSSLPFNIFLSFSIILPEYTDFIKDETMKLKIKFKCNIYCDEMILLLLYKKIEKRGFKVTYKGKELIENYYIDLSIK